MKKFLLFLWFTGFVCSAMSQTDPVLMRINNKPITLSEFEYNYNKNNSEGVLDKKTVEEYVDLFINYKLKVEAALDAKLDTLSSFRKEFRAYRDQQIQPLLVPQTRMEEECRKYYDRMKANLQGKDVILPAHIFLRVKQNASKEEQIKAKERIDSIFQAIENGADFAELAKGISQDPQSAPKGGVLSWIGPNQTLKEFEDVAYSLNKNEISEPFLSTVGYHIVKMMDRKELEPFEELKPGIARFLESKGIKSQLAAQAIDSIASKGASNKSVEQILDEETERLCAEDKDLKYLVQEYHDGLLLYEICNREVWEPAGKDSLGMESFFKKNKKAYAWDKPRFNGMIYYCQQEKDIKAVKKALKKIKPEQWVSTIRDKFNKDSITVRMEKGLFKQGENRNVDILGLKVKKIKPKPIDGFPYVGIVGEKLKKGPKNWQDVSAQVLTDYQRHCENLFVERLRKKYKVEVDKDVLKTVNKH